MSTLPLRRIALGDALILIAIIAMGLACSGLTWPLSSGGDLRHWPKWVTHGPPNRLEFLEMPYHRAADEWNGPLLVLASLSVVCLAVRRSIPNLSKVAGQPGFILSVTMVTVAALTVAYSGAVIDSYGIWQIFILRTIAIRVVTSVSCAAFCVLALLKVTGRYGRVQSTADGVGRALAWLWVVVLALERCRSFLESLQIM